MAEKYGQRPADLLAGDAGALSLDLAVWQVAVKIEGEIHKLARHRKGDGEGAGEIRVKSYMKQLEFAARRESEAADGD